MDYKISDFFSWDSTIFSTCEFWVTAGMIVLAVTAVVFVLISAIKSFPWWRPHKEE